MFTRLQTRESAAKVSASLSFQEDERYLMASIATQAASAFMIDLSQVSQALRGATARSLLVLDEFGKGTPSRW